MLAFEFVYWWYGPGLRQLAQKLWRQTRRIGLVFSVPILVRTLFSPWRRIISYGQASFIDGLRAMLDNFISRAVGMVVRILVIIVAFISMGLFAAFGLVAVVLWPLLPVIGIALIVRGLMAW